MTGRRPPSTATAWWRSTARSSKTPMAEGALWMIERRSLTLGTVGSLAVVASLVIVNAKSKLTLERVLKCDRSLTLGLGDVLSTSGTLAPMTYLFAPRAIKPTKCFKQVRSASHQTNLFAVAAGQLDVASNNSTSLLLNRRNGRHEADEVRVIWESPTLPEDPIIWRKDLDPAIKEKLRQFLLTYGQGDSPAAQRQRANLAKLSIGGFKPADDTHLLPVREMEATEDWLLAKEARDAAKTTAARKAPHDNTAQRVALEARTRAPAAPPTPPRAH